MAKVSAPSLVLVTMALTWSCTQTYDDFVVGGSPDAGAVGGSPATGGTPVTSSTASSGAGAMAASSAGSGGAATATAGSTSAGTGGQGAGPVLAELDCDGTPCAPGEVCCFSGSGAPSTQCHAAGTCTSGAEIACDGPQDCASGQACCAHFSLANQTLYGVHCDASCAGVGDEYWMCTDDVWSCPYFQICADDPLGGGYKYCAH